MGYRVLTAADAFWRRSNQMGVLNTDLAKQLEAGTLGARLWRIEPGQASTKHRHFGEVELYLLLEGAGRVRIGDDVLTLEPHIPVPIRALRFAGRPDSVAVRSITRFMREAIEEMKQGA